MPKPYSTILYDATGKPVGQAPDDPEELKKIFATGQYGFLKSQRVNWKKPDGTIVSTEGAGDIVKQAIDAGWQLETSGAREARQLEEEYGGAAGEAKSFLHGMGNTLTFGGLDVIGEAAGGKAYTTDVKRTKKASPIANVAGNVAGVIAPFLLPGGQGKALADIGKLGAGVKGVAKLGRATEQFVLKGLGGAQGGLVRQALAKGTALGVGAGLEGAAYGAGQFMSEQALGDIDATAENLIAHTGMGVMWGGIGGGALGAGGSIIRRGLGTGANYAKRAKESIVKMYSKATGAKPAEGLVDELGKILDQPATPGTISKIKAKLIGTKAEKFETFRDPENLRIAQQADDLVNDYTTQIADKRDELMDLAEQAHKEGKKIEEFKEIGALLKEADPVSMTTGNLGMLKTANETLDGYIVAGKEIYGQPSVLHDVKALLLEVDDAIGAAARTGNKQAILKTNFAKIYKAKRTIQKRLERLSRMQNKDDAFWKTFDGLEEIETGLRESLEHPAIYGQTVATAVKRNNAAWVQKLRKIKTKAGRAFDEVYAHEKFKPIFKTDRAAIKRTLDKYGMPGNENYQEHLGEWARLEVELAESMGDTLKLGPNHKAIVSRMKTLDSEMGDVLKQAEKTVGVRNQLADIVTKSNQFSTILPSGVAGAGIGYAMGGPEGAAIGLGLSMFTNPGKFLNVKAAIHRMSSQTKVKTAKAISAYIKKATGKVAAVKKPVRAMVAPASMKILQSSNWGDKRTKDETRHKAFTKRAKELTEFLTNQEKTMETIERNTAPVAEVAPRTAEAMQVKAVQSARYLYDRMPKPLVQHSLLHSKFKPSDLELAKFERIAAVIDNPENALKSLKAGMLTVEEVDALRANYPRMYERIVTTLAEQVPELQEKLPYKEQVQLTILFGVPIHPTTEPEFVMTMAAIGAVPPMAPGQPPGTKQPKSKLGSYKDMETIGISSASDTQRIEANKLT